MTLGLLGVIGLTSIFGLGTFSQSNNVSGGVYDNNDGVVSFRTNFSEGLKDVIGIDFVNAQTGSTSVDLYGATAFVVKNDDSVQRFNHISNDPTDFEYRSGLIQDVFYEYTNGLPPDNYYYTWRYSIHFRYHLRASVYLDGGHNNYHFDKVYLRDYSIQYCFWDDYFSGRFVNWSSTIDNNFESLISNYSDNFASYMYFGNFDISQSVWTRFEDYRYQEFDEMWIYSEYICSHLGNLTGISSDYGAAYEAASDFYPEFMPMVFGCDSSYNIFLLYDHTIGYTNAYQQSFVNTLTSRPLIYDGSNLYNEGYQDGYDEGHRSGESTGYSAGYNQGYFDADNQDAIASSIFVGIINIALLPINFFLACLNFEVFGINIGGAVSALLTVAIVFIICRTIFSGGNGSKE